jgi:hypothetical protein
MEKKTEKVLFLLIKMIVGLEAILGNASFDP